MVNCTIKIIRSLIYRTISYHIQINVHLPKKAFHEICMFSSKMISSPNFLVFCCLLPLFFSTSHWWKRSTIFLRFQIGTIKLFDKEKGWNLKVLRTCNHYNLVCSITPLLVLSRASGDGKKNEANNTMVSHELLTFIKEVFLDVFFIPYDWLSSFLFNRWQNIPPMFCKHLLQFLP